MPPVPFPPDDGFIQERYIEVLRITPYTAVGINPSGFIESEVGTEHIIERFV